jgi:para-aminobenzoate synthetase component 1
MNDFGRCRVPFLVLVDFEMQKPLILPLDECSRNGILFRFPGVSNDPERSAPGPRVSLMKHPVAFDLYNAAFVRVMHHIYEGNSYLVNLTFPTPISLNLGLEEIFAYGNAPFLVLVREQCVVFSPERFVRISAGSIAVCPMKGTIDAAMKNAETIILADPKEAAEHVTVVDLLRNDLSTVAQNVRVERYRYIDRITTHEKTLLQVSSRIVGDPGKDYAERLGDLLFALLPAGSICGAPKSRTLEIIREVEGGPRGYYSGICGIFDGKDFDSCVLIRFIEQHGTSKVFRSGGGITHASRAEIEYQELIDKIYVPIV